jgi:hypothetical protein
VTARAGSTGAAPASGITAEGYSPGRVARERSRHVAGERGREVAREGGCQAADGPCR